jgi:STE24 endopeptidase
VMAGGFAGAEQWRLLLIAVTMLAAPFATACDAGRFILRLHRDPLDNQNAWQEAGERYERLQLAATWLWLGCSLAVIYLWDWPQLVRVKWQWQDWPLVDDVLVLAPVIVSLLLVWVAFFYVEQTAQRIRRAPHERKSLCAYLIWQCRHYLAMALLPAFVVLAIQEFGGDHLQAANIAFPKEYLALLIVPVLGLMVMGLPVLLRRLWPTCELPANELRSELEAISRQMQTPLTRMLIWQTQGRMANAAVAGLSRYCRYLFLTDALLVQLTPSEIAAVVRHELGHLQRRHLLLRLLLLALPALAWLVVQPLLKSELDLLSTSSPYSLAVSAVYLAYVVIVVGQFSKWIEYDADMSAILEANGRVNADHARDLIHALVALQGPQRESRLTNWLHPPTSLRIAWIRRVLVQPVLGFAFRRRLDRVSRGILAIAVALIACALLAGIR